MLPPSGALSETEAISHDVHTMMAALFPRTASPVASLRPLIDPLQIYSYERMLADAKLLQRQYPELITIEDIGTSRFGRRLIAIRLGRGPLEITLNGAHHGREWMTATLLMQMIDAYALAFYQGERIDGYDPYELLARVSIWFVPMVNPDGVALSQQGASTAPDPAAVIRLNRGSGYFSAWKANGHGVDLNRQYPARWNHISNAAPHPGVSHYKGTAPLTEPEAQAMYAFACSRRFANHTAFHSSGNIIFWHFHQGGELRARTLTVAERLHQFTSYTLVPPQPIESGGGYKDWVVQDLQVPAFTIEVGTPSGNKAVPLAQYRQIWSQVRAVGLLLAQEAVDPSTRSAYLEGYLDGELARVDDDLLQLKSWLMQQVDSGQGVRVHIIERATRVSRWEYPTDTVFAVIVNGARLGTHANFAAAQQALTAAMAERTAFGGLIVSNTRRVVQVSGQQQLQILQLREGADSATLNGAAIPMAETAQTRDGRMYVPLSLLAGAFGAELFWHPETQSALIRKGDMRMLLPVGSRLMMLNQQVLRQDGKSLLMSRGTVLVPLRVVAEAFGGCVSWDAESATAAIRWFLPSGLPADQEIQPAE